jgi:hypothetical protein
VNERMKTLCQNAFQEVHESRVGTDGLIRTDGNPYIFYEKFAELIVRECALICESRPGPGDDVRSRQHCSLQILEHFGVES